MAWNKAFTNGHAGRSNAEDHPDDLDDRRGLRRRHHERDPVADVEPGQSGEPVAEGAGTVEAEEVLEPDLRPGSQRGLGPPRCPPPLRPPDGDVADTRRRRCGHGDRLRRIMVPDGGHLIHMPTHIDVLCGNYHDVVFWNREATRADASGGWPARATRTSTPSTGTTTTTS